MILIKDCYYYQRKNQRCKEKGRYFTAEIKKIVERYYNLFYLKIFKMYVLEKGTLNSVLQYR